MRNCLGHSCESSEDSRHDLSNHEGYEEVDEELRWFSSKTSEKVKDEVEHGRGSEFDGYVGNDASNGFGCRVVERIRLVLFDDWTLCVKTVDLIHGRKSVEEDSEEQDSTFGHEAYGSIGSAIEDGTNDESHENVNGDCGCRRR